MKYWYCLIDTKSLFSFLRANNLEEAMDRYVEYQYGTNIHDVTVYTTACTLEDAWNKNAFLIKDNHKILIKASHCSAEDLTYYNDEIIPFLGGIAKVYFQKKKNLKCSCGDPAPYDEANQDDGTFKCYRCRKRI